MILPRSFVFVALAVIASAAVALFAWVRQLSAPGYRGPISDHFDGQRFFNVEPTRDKSIVELLRWTIGDRAKNKVWRWRAVTPTRPEKQVDQLRITLVNHATILLQVAGMNIVTDPIWSERTSPLSWAGPRRFHEPGIRFEDLPPIDAVLISHNHWDHLDLPTLRRLARAHHPRLIVPLGNADFLRRNGIDGAVDVDWWNETQLSDEVTITPVPVQHWSTRTRRDLRKTLWCGYVVSTPADHVYFAGDTGFGSGKVFDMARERFGGFAVVLLPIGAFLPRWFMKDSHLDPADAIQAHRRLGAAVTIPMHFGCFDLGNDSQDEARDLLRQELTRLGSDAPEFWLLQPGESRDLP